MGNQYGAIINQLRSVKLTCSSAAAARGEVRDDWPCFYCRTVMISVVQIQETLPTVEICGDAVCMRVIASEPEELEASTGRREILYIYFTRKFSTILVPSNRKFSSVKSSKTTRHGFLSVSELT
jgi:hypothetical protein